MVNKKTSMKDTMVEINKKFGDGSVMIMGEEHRVKIDAISTGSFSLDRALGVGGFPKGRIVEIYGPESSGKSTLALSIIAQAQKLGGEVVFVDAEHALDLLYAQEIGVNLDTMAISQPESGEEALNIVETFVKSKSPAVIVIDSVSALTPRAEIDGEMGAQFIGLQARMMSQAMRKLTAITAKSKTIIVFINQIRMNAASHGYGNPETTSGGRALRFYASVRVDVRRRAQIKKGEETVGIRVKAKIVKNKVAPPFKIAEFDIMYGEGISYESDVLNVALAEKVVTKSGSTYSFGKKKLGVGFDNVRISLKIDTVLVEEIKKAINKA